MHAVNKKNQYFIKTVYRQSKNYYIIHMRTLKCIVTKSWFDKRTRKRDITTVKPEDYVEPEQPQHNNNCTFDPLSRSNWHRGDYLKRGYGR